MADLIERDALVSLWKPLADRDCFTGNVIASCLNELNAQPTIDAEPVVRCKDCKHRGTDNCPMHCKGVHADEDFLKKVDNDFCSYGERKGEVSE